MVDRSTSYVTLRNVDSKTVCMCLEFPKFQRRDIKYVRIVAAELHLYFVDNINRVDQNRLFITCTVINTLEDHVMYSKANPLSGPTYQLRSS